MDSFAEVDSCLALGRDQILKAPEHVTCSCQGNNHRLQFAKDGVPLLHAGAPLGLGDAVKYFPQPLNAVGRKVDFHADGVQNPAEDELDGVPAAADFAQLF